MKKRIYISLCFTSLVLVLLTAGVMLWVSYGMGISQAKNSLKNQTIMIENGISFVGDEQLGYLDTEVKGLRDMRITWLNADGSVLFDTSADSASMENHSQRPEMIAALQKGEGTDVRHSQTVGQDSVYYAKRLSDGSVLRLSMQTKSVGTVFQNALPLVLGIVVMLLGACFVIASQLTKRILLPVKQLAQNIEDDQEYSGYGELEPFYHKIKEQNRMIKSQMDKLADERDRISTITSNMREGLILVDLQKDILSVNKSALSLLEVKKGDYEGKGILTLCRNVEFSHCVDQAVEGTGCDILLENGRGSVQVYANPVFAGKKVCGGIILLVDVTQQQKAEKIRRDFTANVSHELKTPLTSISGFAEMISGGMVSSPQDIKKFAGRIYREASRLITLTDDIIRLSQIEEGTDPEKEPISLRPICENVLNTLQIIAQQKQVSLSIQGEEGQLSANPRMMEELIFNLCDNGIKYNQPGGSVKISIRQEPGEVVLSVKDTGIGIPKEHQSRIFERFYRVDKSRSKQTGGTGLGLSIVKHIVESHRGSLTLESQEGEGTEVTIRFPL